MNKINYDEKFSEITSSLNGRRSLLLHACCAPCSSAVLERVTPFFDVTLLFFNPNITDEEEYYKRLKELERFVGIVYGEKIKVIDGGFSPYSFFAAAKGLENEREGGARCSVCYEQRLLKCAALAKDKNYDFFGTTLSVSPYKDADRLNSIGGALERKFGVQYLYSDFKKRQGYVRSIELSKQYGLYRQNYCGCVFSQAIKGEKEPIRR